MKCHPERSEGSPKVSKGLRRSPKVSEGLQRSPKVSKGLQRSQVQSLKSLRSLRSLKYSKNFRGKLAILFSFIYFWIISNLVATVE
jgi:hypothetical protein